MLLQRQRNFGIALFVLFAFMISAATAAFAVEQSRDQQACINAVAKGFAKVSQAQGKLIARCIKDGAAEKLGGTIDDCALNDADGKVAKAEAKAAASIAGKCTVAPDFGPSDLGGVTGNTEAIAARMALINDVFGSDLEGAIVKSSVNAIRSKCQQTVVKSVEGCWKTYTKSFNSCLKSGLKGRPTLIEDAAGIEACRNADPKGKVVKACRAKFTSKVDKACGFQDMEANMPGCICQEPVSCVHAGVGNALNPALDTVNNMPPGPIVAPYLRKQYSDVGMPWLDDDGDELWGLRVIGREADAPLTCRLGAINSHTVQDPVADAAYNAGVSALLFSVGEAKFIHLADPSVDFTGTSRPDLVQHFQAMPWYGSAHALMAMTTHVDFFDLNPLKIGQVGDTLRFGLTTCLYDCAGLEASASVPVVPFGTRQVIVHLQADRATLDASVADLATDAAGLAGIDLIWVGRVVAGLKSEYPDGSVVENIAHPIVTNTNIVYALNAVADPALITASPTLSGLLAASAEDGVAFFE